MTNPHRRQPFRALRARDILRQSVGRRIVVIAPHPDDETLGCGGLIARAVRCGVGVAVVALTDGDASHPGSTRWPPAALARLRAGEMRRALARLGAGAAPVRRLGWGDGRAGIDGSLAALRRCLIDLDAGVVLATSAADHHPDHQVAARLAIRAARDLRLPVFSYAIWSRTGSAGRRRGRYLAAKRWAMAAHRSQVADYITDDPSGFRLDVAMIDRATRAEEVFARCRPD